MAQRSRRRWSIKVIDQQTVTPSSWNLVHAITRVFLVDPASAAGQGNVHASIRIGHQTYTLASLSAERPCEELLYPFELDEAFTLYVPRGHCFQVEGYQYHRPKEDAEEASSSDDDEEADSLEDFSEDSSDDEDYDYSTEEEEEEEEESPDEVDGQAAMTRSTGDVMRNFAASGQFVAPRFASSGSTAGFMRVASVESQEKGDNGNTQILVFYRCTHFSATYGEGVRVRKSTPVYQLQFVVPPAGNIAMSLQSVGASLAPHIYPFRYRKRLYTLWSSLIAVVGVPTRAARLEVLVDFGIIPTIDRTPKHMEQMRATLKKNMVGKDFHPEIHLEFQLPAPTQCGAGEYCAVCYELLGGDGLAMWAGCAKPHVFHGACLDLVLKRSDKCPLCRNLWSIEPKPLNIRQVVGYVTMESNDAKVDEDVSMASSETELDGNITMASTNAEADGHVAKESSDTEVDDTQRR